MLRHISVSAGSVGAASIARVRLAVLRDDTCATRGATLPSCGGKLAASRPAPVGSEDRMAGFLFRLETVDGAAADPATLEAAVSDWKAGAGSHTSVEMISMPRPRSCSTVPRALRGSSMTCADPGRGAYTSSLSPVLRRRGPAPWSPSMPPWAELSPLRPWRAVSATGRRGFRYVYSGKKVPWRQASGKGAVGASCS